MADIHTRISQRVDALEKDLVTFIQELVRVPSLPGEEGKASSILAAKLEAVGMQAVDQPVNPKKLRGHPAFCDDGFAYDNRRNVIGILHGQTHPMDNPSS